MTRRILILHYCILLSFLVLRAEPLAAQVNTVPARDRMVVVISLDGFPAYALEDPKLPLPTLRRLAAEGARAKAMVTNNPTVTWPITLRW